MNSGSIVAFRVNTSSTLVIMILFSQSVLPCGSFGWFSSSRSVSSGDVSPAVAKPAVFETEQASTFSSNKPLIRETQLMMESKEKSVAYSCWQNG
eukprot:c17964_g3_i1 orf=53-337(+)